LQIAKNKIPIVISVDRTDKVIAICGNIPVKSAGIKSLRDKKLTLNNREYFCRDIFVDIDYQRGRNSVAHRKMLNNADENKALVKSSEKTDYGEDEYRIA
jgi:hypothetical protein